MPCVRPWIAMTLCLCGSLGAAQTAETLGAVKRIYVEPFTAKPGAGCIAGRADRGAGG